MRSIRSRQVHLAGIFGMLALFGVGCGGGGGHSNAFVYAQWTVADLDTPSLGLYCTDVDAGNVVLSMVNVNDPKQNPYIDTFPCNSLNYAGTSASVPVGTYSITVSLMGDPQVYGNNTTVLDQLGTTQTLGSGTNTLPQSDFQVNSFVLGWSVTSSGLPTTCAGVGARFVALDVTFAGQSQPTPYYLDCYNNGPPLKATPSLPFGTYSVQWQASLVDANDYYVPGIPTTPLTNYTVTTGVQANLGTAYFAY